MHANSWLSLFISDDDRAILDTFPARERLLLREWEVNRQRLIAGIKACDLYCSKVQVSSAASEGSSMGPSITTETLSIVPPNENGAT